MNGHAHLFAHGGVHAHVDAVLRFRWPVILLVCALTAIAGSGLRFLDFDADTRIFFAQDNPERRAFETMEKTFKRVNALVFVVAPQNGRVFSRDALQAIEWLTERAWDIPHATSVSSLANQFHSRGIGDEIIVEPLIPRARDMGDDDIASAANAAAARRDLIGLMLSPELDVTGVMALVNPPGRDRHEVQQMAQHAYALADELRERFPGIDVYLSGGVMADMAFNEAARRGLTTLLPAMILLVILALTVGLRSIRNTLITLTVVAAALVTTLGLAGWAGLALNTVSSIAPLAILTLAISDCVHVTIGMGQQLRAGRGLRDAVGETMRIHTLPVIVTSVTTALGFLTLNFSASPPFRELGNLIAFGMLVALIYVLMLLPALLSLIPDRRAPARLAWEQIALRRLADRVIARRRPLLALGLLTTVVLGVGVSRITLDDDFIRYFDDSYDFRVGSDFMERRLTGLNVIQYALSSGEEQGIARPDYLETVDAFTNFLRTQDKIDHVATMIE
ncbi:MAG: efflux RND transporter permease subunit, partial [Chromatiales bacterium]|nr:efflux RND transporter permease subunit [Chromatiales bacterium]